MAAHNEQLNRSEVERRKRAAEAKARAEKLLVQCFTPEQKTSLDVRGFFYVAVGEKKYRIERGYAGNVKLVDAEDRPIESFCIHPSVRVPDADAMLAQKLLLEADEAAFLRTANRTRLLQS